MNKDERTIAQDSEALGNEKAARGKGHRDGDPVANFVMQLAQSYLEKRSDTEASSDSNSDTSKFFTQSALDKPGWFCRG
ncbi:MAG: hypothetical protein LOD94_08755 [Gammaproteobacteria bacterium]|nr:hypothetical protein [Gammaproteobacteria bacterium]